MHVSKAKRWTSGCKLRFKGIWREAFDGDKVCVSPEFRGQMKKENAAARQRIAK